MSDNDDVLAADDQFFAALNAMFDGDIAPMEALWSHADDVIYMGPMRELFHVGWKVTDEDWVQQGKMHLGGAIKVLKRHMTVSGALAVVHHVADASGQDPSDKTFHTAMRGTNVFRKENGAWKLIAHHSDPLPYLEA